MLRWWCCENDGSGSVGAGDGGGYDEGYEQKHFR